MKKPQNEKQSDTKMPQNERLDNENNRFSQQMQNMEHALKYLQIPMVIFGFYHRTNKDTAAERSNKRIINSKATLYNFLVWLIAWLWFVGRLMSFFVGENRSQFNMLRTIPVIWGFQVAANVTIMLKASHPKFGHVLDAYALWTKKVMPIISDINTDTRPTNLKRCTIMTLVIGLLTILCNSVLAGVFMFYPHTSYYDIVPNVLVSPLPVNTFTKCITLLVMVYQVVAWIFPMLYVIGLCQFLKYCFRTCFDSVCNANKHIKDRNLFPTCIYKQRIMHLNLCKIVETFDKDMKYLYANVCFTNVPFICFLMYQVFRSDLDYVMKTTYVFWIIFCLLWVILTCSFAVMVHKTAHSPLDALYETGMKGVSLEQLGQMNLFISKLTASPVGFTVLDFFIITNEMLLTVGGFFLTYTFVLLQF